jgi:hypothetical protein
MVFDSGAVIGVSGVDFVVEPADPYSFIAMPKLTVPRGFFFIKINAEKAGGAVLFLSPVAGVLGVSSKAEIILSIIEAITISMVNNKASRRIHYFPVHIHGACFIGFGKPEPDGI